VVARWPRPGAAAGRARLRVCATAHPAAPAGALGAFFQIICAAPRRRAHRRAAPHSPITRERRTGRARARLKAGGIAPSYRDGRARSLLPRGSVDRCSKTKMVLGWRASEMVLGWRASQALAGVCLLGTRDRHTVERRRGGGRASGTHGARGAAAVRRGLGSARGAPVRAPRAAAGVVRGEAGRAARQPACPRHSAAGTRERSPW